MSKKIGVLLSGCGVKDGSEIHEAVLTLLSLDQLDAEVVCIGVNKKVDVVDHSKDQPVPEKRNAMIEAARIARGEIADAARVRAGELDALIIPGGFGAVSVLSNYAMKGTLGNVDPNAGKLIAGMVDAKKPVGAICIAPATLACALRDVGYEKVKLTVGNDPDTAAKINEMEQEHVECPVDDIVVDEEHKIVTTPAYMLGKSVKEIQPGIDKLVRKVFDLA